jgi:hypothetical protein
MNDRLILAEKQGEKQIETYEPIGVPEVYVDGFHGIYASGATIKIHFFSRVMPDPEKSATHERREIVSRVVLGVDTFLAVVQALNGVADQLRKDLQVRVAEPRQGNS